MAKSPVNIEDLDVEQLGDQELHAMLSRINEALHGRFSTRTQEFRDLAREMGFAVTLTKLGKEPSRRGPRPTQEEDRRRSVAPKYRNPDNSAETWSGRGREPHWYKDKIAAGTPEESLLIQQEQQSTTGEG